MLSGRHSRATRCACLLVPVLLVCILFSASFVRLFADEQRPQQQQSSQDDPNKLAAEQRELQAWREIVETEKQYNASALPVFGRVDLDSIEVRCESLMGGLCQVEMSLDGLTNWTLTARTWHYDSKGGFERIQCASANTRYYFRAIHTTSSGDIVLKTGTVSIRTSRVCCITPGLNTSSTLAFSVGSLLPFVDKYIYVDTASEDDSIGMLTQLFPEQLVSGRLLIISNSQRHLPPRRWDGLGSLRQIGIEYAKLAGCNAFLKVDGDEAFYDWAAEKLVRRAKQVPNCNLYYAVPSLELHQETIFETLPWLEELKNASQFGHHRAIYSKNDHGRYWGPRVYPTTCSAAGSWTDEAQGLQAEGYRNCGTLCGGDKWQEMGMQDIHGAKYHAHYGWARPLIFLRWKRKVWTGNEADHKEGYGSSTLFTKHPEVVARMVDKVMEWFQR